MGSPSGFDRTRNVEIGNKNIKLHHLEEAYTTANWLVRIYRLAHFMGGNAACYPLSVHTHIASFQGIRKIGESAWYTLFMHARSLLGNLHTVCYTNHASGGSRILKRGVHAHD